MIEENIVMKKKLAVLGIIGALMGSMLTGCSETEEAQYTTDLMSQAYDAGQI